MSEKPTTLRPTQLNLFRPEPKTPAWRTLPTAVRKEVKVLLARLFREHCEAHQKVSRVQEASDE